jgi:hypothetical protein
MMGNARGGAHQTFNNERAADGRVRAMSGSQTQRGREMTTNGLDQVEGEALATIGRVDADLG